VFGSPREAEKTALTIVRAVNSHEQLITALETVASEFADTETANMPEWLENVEAALAAAKE